MFVYVDTQQHREDLARSGNQREDVLLEVENYEVNRHLSCHRKYAIYEKISFDLIMNHAKLDRRA
jgi:hypothetical protein